MSPAGYSEFQGTRLIEGFFGFRDLCFKTGGGAIRKIWQEFFVCLDLSEDNILGGENNLKARERSKTKLDLRLFQKLALHNNLVPRAFPLKNGWCPNHFLREKPWGRG